MSPIPKSTLETPVEFVQEPIPVIQTPPQPESIRAKSHTKAPITWEHLSLVEEIEWVTGDTWSLGHFINIVRKTDEQTIHAALSVTREKKSLGGCRTNRNPSVSLLQAEAGPSKILHVLRDPPTTLESLSSIESSWQRRR